MDPPLVCLSKETKAQASRLIDSSQPFTTIQCAQVIVGITREPKLPSRVVLPAGLEHVADSVQLEKLLSAEESPPEVIALRYAGTLCINLRNMQQTLQKFKNADLLTVAGKVFRDQSLLKDLIAADEVRNMHRINVYNNATLSGTESSEVEGLSLTFSDQRNSGLYDVCIDVIAYCPPISTKSQVLSQLSLAIERVLFVAHSVDEQLNVVVSHYPVFGSALMLTVVSPTSEENEDEANPKLTLWRKSIHGSFLFPMDRPLLKRSCRQTLDATMQLGDGGCPGRLANVHIGIKAHGLGEVAVTEHLVQGDYLYCHYMQNKFNDSGWGCAYRSLQTILSWCALQKYASFTEGVLPTHEQIQKSLVDVGDKPSKFVGSKEWIGANEVCYALEKMTGVTSKILHVSKGGEMESHGRELARHFDEQGSPVMVGGGVLAWTILGVARNSRTGKTKFLILDPHYEGRDELGIIQNKGWIGWKGGEVFKQNAFYNLCMPLRPSGV